MKLLKKKKIKLFNFLYFIINLIKIFLYKKYIIIIIIL